MQISARAYITGLALLALTACSKSEPSATIDPQFLEARRAMMTELCGCAEVPRDQAKACLAARKARAPKPPGGGDVEAYTATLRAADRAELADIAARSAACSKVLAETGG